MTQDSSLYDPDQYWQDRGGPSYRTYTESPGYAPYHEAQQRFFTGLVSRFQPQRLLDFGCGTGKLFPLWLDVPEVHAFDRAQSQIDVARREAAQIRPQNPYSILHYVAGERTEVPYDDDYFDLVVAAEVLLHVLPTDIGPLIDELHRISRGHLALVTATPFTNPAAHCFDHDYAALLLGRFEILDDHAVHRQRYLVGRKVPSVHNLRTPGTVLVRSSTGKRSPHAIVTS